MERSSRLESCKELIKSLNVFQQYPVLKRNEFKYAGFLERQITFQNFSLRRFHPNLTSYIQEQCQIGKEPKIEDAPCGTRCHFNQYLSYGKYHIEDFEFCKYVSEFCKKSINIMIGIVEESAIHKFLMSSMPDMVKNQMRDTYQQIITCVIICQLAKMFYLMEFLISIDQIEEIRTINYKKYSIERDFNQRIQTSNDNLYIKTKAFDKNFLEMMDKHLYPQYKKLYDLLAPNNIENLLKSPDAEAFFGGYYPEHVSDIRRDKCKLHNYFYLKIFKGIARTKSSSLKMPTVSESESQVPSMYIEI